MTILENEISYEEETHLKEKKEDEEDLDLRNSTIQITRQKASLDISIKKENITSIKGVGGRVAEKLRGANFNTITGIASTTAERLSQINGIGEATAEKIIAGAKEIVNHKNLQNFSVVDTPSVEENNGNGKPSNDEANPVIIEPLKKIVTGEKPWFEPKFKIQRNGGHAVTERPKIEETILPEEFETEKIEYEMEDVEEEEDEIINEVESNFEITTEYESPIEVKPNSEVKTLPKIEISDEKIDPKEKTLIIKRVVETLQAEGYYILKKRSTMKDLFAHIDIMALKNIHISDLLEFVIFIPLKVSMLKGKIQISNEVIKYIPTHENFKRKGSVFKQLVDSYFGSLDKSHELINNELEKGTVLASVNRCLKKEISLKTSITKKNLFYSSGPQQFKILVEPILVCQGEVSFLDKVTPFAYLKDSNLHVLVERKLPELLQFIEHKYTLVESHKTKETNLLSYYETHNQFLKRSELFSIPFIIFALGLFAIIGLQLFQLLGLFLNIGYGLLGIYFITLLFFYLKYFKVKLEVQSDFKKPYYENFPELDETSLVLINEELNRDLMSQFVYECVGKDADAGFVADIEEDQITKKLTRKQLEKTVNKDGFYENISTPISKEEKPTKTQNNYKNKFDSFLED